MPPVAPQVLEAMLPDSAADMLELVVRHTRQGPSARFAACQLAIIAADCMVGGALALVCAAACWRWAGSTAASRLLLVACAQHNTYWCHCE